MRPDGTSEGPDEESEAKARRARILAKCAEVFVLLSVIVYGAAALAMAAISVGLIFLAFTRVYFAFSQVQNSDGVLLDAVSSLVISVAILDVAKYVMEEEVLRNRELRKPSEAREAVTKFMVIIALVVSIEGIVLVFDLGRTSPELLLFPILLLVVSVVIVVGLGVFQMFSLRAEESLEAADRAKGKPSKKDKREART